mmetsp:Transcript_24589/g.54779  ORF Transcript_24589/g.54779 Transcript_24589/m.54779 type:complete len:156 (+) Transcript_24589:80-547(+)
MTMSSSAPLFGSLALESMSRPAKASKRRAQPGTAIALNTSRSAKITAKLNEAEASEDIVSQKESPSCEPARQGLFDRLALGLPVAPYGKQAGQTLFDALALDMADAHGSKPASQVLFDALALDSSAGRRGRSTKMQVKQKKPSQQEAHPVLRFRI